jgi:hypothetical protein
MSKEKNHPIKAQKTPLVPLKVDFSIQIVHSCGNTTFEINILLVEFLLLKNLCQNQKTSSHFKLNSFELFYFFSYYY